MTDIFDDLLSLLAGPEDGRRRLDILAMVRTQARRVLNDISTYDHFLHAVDLSNDVYDDPDLPEDQWDAAQEARNRYVGVGAGANVLSSELAAIDGTTTVGEARTGQHTIALDLDFPCQIVSGGGRTLVSLDYREQGIEPDSDGLLAALGSLLVLGAAVIPKPRASSVFQPTPRGIVFETPHHARWYESSTPGHGHLYIDAILWWDEYEALLETLAWAGLVEPDYVAASKRRKATHLRLPWVKKGES